MGMADNFDGIDRLGIFLGGEAVVIRKQISNVEIETLAKRIKQT